MAGGFDGSVNIDTGMDTRGFKSGMDGILTAAKAGATEINKTFSNMSVVKQLAVLDETVKRVGEGFDGWSVDKQNAALQVTMDTMASLAFESMTYEQQMEVLGETIKRVGWEFNGWPLDKQNAALQDTIDGVDRLADGTIRATKDTDKLADSTKKVAIATDNLPAKTNKWGTAINGVKRGFLQMASALIPGLYRINRFSLGIDKVNESATGAGKAFTKAFIVGAVGIVAVIVLVAALVGAFMSLYKKMLQMDGFKDNVKGLELAFANLKNAAMSAIMPLFNAILPIVMKVVAWLTEAANAAAAFIAALSGAGTYMVYVADSTGDAGSSAGTWADEVERGEEAVKGALAGFDQLNVLQMKDTNPDTPGGGGGGGTGHWEERIIGEDIKTKVKGILDFFASVKLFFKTMKDEGWEAAFRELLGVPEEKNTFFTIVGGWIDQAKLWFSGLATSIKTGDWSTMVDWYDTYFLQPLATKFGLTWTGPGGIKQLIAGVVVGIKTGNWSTLAKWFDTATLQPLAKAFGLTWTGPAGIERLINGVSKGLRTGDWSTVGAWFNTAVLQPLTKTFGLTWEGENGIKHLVDGVSIGLRTGDWSTFSSWMDTNVLAPLLANFGLKWEGEGGIKQLIEGVSKGLRTGDWSTLGDWFGTNVWGLIKASADGMWKAMLLDANAIAGTIGTSIGGLIIGAVNAVIGVINRMLLDIQNVVNGILDAIDILHSGKKYITIEPIGEIVVPGGGSGGEGGGGGGTWRYAATGAVIPPNAPFAAIYGDQRFGRNLESPESLMRQIVREETAGMGGQGNQAITINFAGSLSALVGALKPYIDKENVRIGGSLVSRSTG